MKTNTINKKMGEFYNTSIQTWTAETAKDNYTILSWISLDNKNFFQMSFLKNNIVKFELPNCNLDIIIDTDLNYESWLENGEVVNSHQLILETIEINENISTKSKIQNLYYIEKGKKIRLLTL